MSKRLQVLLPEEELRRIRAASRREHKTVAEWVRESLRQRLESARPESPDVRAGRILRFAKHAGPTGSIEQILGEIERGREAT